jgi:hypothetical protein
MDHHGTEGGRWLTYAELAAIRGIGRASAVKLVQRERWQRSSGNDRARTVRVLVPDDWLQPARERSEPSGKPPQASVENGGILAAIEAAHAGEVARLNARIDVLMTRSETMAAEILIVQAKLAEAERAHEQARADAQATQDRLEAYRREEASRKARGLVARLMAAWRRE